MFGNQTMTRADFVTALLLTRGFDPRAQAPLDATFGGKGFGAGSSTFSDVPLGSRPFAHITLAHRLTVVEGDPDGRFRPDDPVTRIEVAVAAVKAAGWMGQAHEISWSQAADTLKAAYLDWEAVAEGDRSYLALAVSHNLVKAPPDESSSGVAFGPQTPCARGEVKRILSELREVAPPPSKLVAVPGGATLGSAPAGATSHVVSARTLRVRATRSMLLTATAYGPNPIDCYPFPGTHSSLGLPVREGIVAVDPKVIPLGTHLFVEGYGYAVAADEGGAIKGKRMDLLFKKPREEILEFGIRELTVLFVD